MRRAFTLVELLVTIVIIMMLGAMSLAALSTVQRAAKTDATRATIAKINTIIMDKYESYRHRRLPFKPVNPGVFADVPQVGGVYLTASEVAGRRLDAMRDLMRMEMPDRWNDVGDPPISFAWTQPSSGSAHPWTTALAITQRWQTRYTTAQNALLAKGYSADDANKALGRYASAKLLYMIVTAHDPEAMEHFRSDEVAVMEDGFRVFVDAWGNPIKWLRWAPGFDQSDFQPAVSPIDNSTARADATTSLPDPLNSRKVYRAGSLLAPATTETGTPTGGAGAIGIGWGLYPLIYSAGPDGIYDIVAEHETTDASGDKVFYHYTGNPYEVFTTESPARSMGSGMDSSNTSVTGGETATNGSADHYDNITNHRMDVR